MQKFFILFYLFLLSSCKDYQVLYSKEYNIDVQNWTYNDSVEFAFDSKDSTLVNDIVLSVKHKPNFGFENLYVTIQTAFPDHSQVSDRVSLALSDNRGKWLGKCNSTTCLTEIYLQENVKLKVGLYRLQISQDSRIDSLKGIESMKLEIHQRNNNAK